MEGQVRVPAGRQVQALGARAIRSSTTAWDPAPVGPHRPHARDGSGRGPLGRRVAGGQQGPYHVDGMQRDGTQLRPLTGLL